MNIRTVKKMLTSALEEDVWFFAPDNDQRFLSSRLYWRVKALADDPADEKRWSELQHYIDRRLQSVAEIIEEYSREEVHFDALDTLIDMLRSFLHYQEGLDELHHLFNTLKNDTPGHEVSIRSVVAPFAMIYQGDRHLLEAENSLKALIEKPLHLVMR